MTNLCYFSLGANFSWNYYAMLQAADSYYWYLTLSPAQIKDGLLKARKMEYLIANTN